MNILNLKAVIEELKGIEESNILGGILVSDLEQAEKDAEFLLDIANKIKELLNGIDKDECEDDYGWWQTSSGAEFGAKKLKEILDLFSDSNESIKPD